MPMTDMPMPGESWPAAALAFLGMWVVMMAAMMLPSLAPALWRYRRAVASATHPGLLTGVVCAGYFFVWTVSGVAAFALGAVLPALAGDASPVAGAVVLIAGLFQFSTWKAYHLACWRDTAGRVGSLAANRRTAWRTGLRLGAECVQSCAGLMAVMLVSGNMDVRWMAVVTAAITAERLTPRGERVARAIGVVAIGAGMLLVVPFRR
jgi:predicted metal-binding membrane protein